MTAYENLKELVDGFEPMLVKVMHDNKHDLREFITEQLYSGIDGEDKELHPTYLNDPWFNSDDAGRWKNNARGYMMWKKEITNPLPSYLGISARKYNVPNLIITGSFYDSIRPIPTSKGILIESRGFDDGPFIESKYGSNIFGLSSYARNFFIKYTILDEIDRYFSKYSL